MASVDHYSLLDHDVPSSEQKGKISKKQSNRADTVSVSAAIGRENARLGMPGSTAPCFPGEDSGHSLAELARADLDAALQLLAERAQYITEASGVAIALRRGAHHDMLCRARAGSNAPELGALLSIDYGLSGESVRTRQMLRCDDTERDTRVNRDLCRELGIASVVIVPILIEQQAVGIFELLSSKAHAFNERDFSALTRLSEMVATAVKHSGLDLEMIAPAGPGSEHQPGAASPHATQPKPEAREPAADPDPVIALPENSSPNQSRREIASKKPLFWSAALQAQASAGAANIVENSAVPAVLRDLKKCQACGFPVSRGRTFCVECEEKQWRGRNSGQAAVKRSPETPRSLPQTGAAPHKPATQTLDSTSEATIEAPEPVIELVLAAAASATGSGVSEISATEPSVADELARPGIIPASAEAPCAGESAGRADVSVIESPSIFLSATLPTESWLAANKYILIVLLVVALAIGAFAVLR